MLDALSLSLGANIAVFVIAAAVIAWAGTRLAGLGDRIADRTGLGEAVTGTLFLGLTTSLPGLAASITAALDGHPALAISNAVGGIALQTTFLAVADITYPKVNLEHAAASVTNMIQAAMLIVLLGLVLMGFSAPEAAVANVHPMSALLLAAAVAGFLLVYRSSKTPMWKPRQTRDTVEDIPKEEYRRQDLGRLIAGYAVTAAIVILAGAAVAHTVGNIVETTGLSESVAGGLLSALATSLPELVTTIAAVRAGALTLAVSDIVGGNYFDVLFVFAADVFYLKGSIYHAEGVGEREQFLTGLALLLNAVLLLGLLYRQRAGPGNIGFESFLILTLYLAGFSVLGFLM